jgi:hypothetical protein
MNMFQNATISGGNITFNLVQQQWSMTINNCSSFRYCVWQLRSAILLAIEMMNEWTPTFLKYFYAGIVQSNLCWKIHNKYVFHVNTHIFVLKYLVQKQIIQNQFKISEGGKWNSHQMPCVYSSRKVKHYCICPIRIEIIHGRHRVVHIDWAFIFLDFKIRI